MKKFALVLGGGSSKGYAHIGVLKVLERYNIRPDLIVGTSMGALVGGLYAKGKSAEELERMTSKINSLGSFDLFSMIFKDNIININKVKKVISSEFLDTKIEECDTEFVAIATELYTGKEKRFTSGPMIDGVMASISIPGVFPRVKIEDEYYCDGGIINNLPEDVAREMLPDAVILSIDVLGDYASQVEKGKNKLMDIMINVSTLMTSNIVKNKPQYADVRLTMTLPEVSQMDFSPKAVKTAIEAGEREMNDNIDRLLELLGAENILD